MFAAATAAPLRRAATAAATSCASSSASSATASSSRTALQVQRCFHLSAASASAAKPTQPVSQPSDGGNKAARGSTSALDYKLSHRLRKLPPLPSLEPPVMEASEAVSNILYNTPPPSKEPFTRHILNCLVQNEPGVLSRVAGTLAARGFNIDSLVVCATEIRDLSRMCIVLRGQDAIIEQARRQLEDLVPVWAVLDYTQTQVIEREMMLVKVSILGPEYFEESQIGLGSNAIPSELLAEREATRSDEHGDDVEGGNAHTQQSQHRTPLTPTEALRVKSDNMRAVIALAEQFKGKVVDVSHNSVTVECSAKSSRIDALLKLLRPFGVLECARSGTMVMPRAPIESSLNSDELTPEEAVAVDASLLPPG
ncbi:acetolactate synthase, regulatory subunit [Tilletia horrida]|uniref:Acetolactate synthase, regulatory subunit n=1 Tax=Tilletia horrida TaxID=155126 RepID=A0AAN6JMG5_9BASI|nr:acetolactate synthase, regulatory subunit [Tilletia horrida]KAK0532852.1 acetolactate synthase, regulatory subunit [Tilletia horrida]KAK0539767.1 acetolactate synthase, regulatory subunit [Tilletia horrida]KAK0565488.1 acetolactate synthase, regulatory subunit [Tilletia horrida]